MAAFAHRVERQHSKTCIRRAERHQRHRACRETGKDIRVGGKAAATRCLRFGAGSAVLGELRVDYDQTAEDLRGQENVSDSPDPKGSRGAVVSRIGGRHGVPSSAESLPRSRRNDVLAILRSFCPLDVMRRGTCCTQLSHTGAHYRAARGR